MPNLSPFVVYFSSEVVLASGFCKCAAFLSKTGDKDKNESGRAMVFYLKDQTLKGECS